MNFGDFGEGDALNQQLRYARSRTWLQFYVDLFTSACPQYCKGLNLTVVPDPARRNGCNWDISVTATETEPEQARLCLDYIEEDMRLLYSIFDMESGESGIEAE